LDIYPHLYKQEIAHAFPALPVAELNPKSYVLTAIRAYLLITCRSQSGYSIITTTNKSNAAPNLLEEAFEKSVQILACPLPHPTKENNSLAGIGTGYRPL